MTNYAKKNVLEYASVYRDGPGYVIVETGQPADAVRIGVGSTLSAAYAALEGTPIQSTGSDNGLAAALAWAHGADWCSDPDDLESVKGAVLTALEDALTSSPPTNR